MTTRERRLLDTAITALHQATGLDARVLPKTATQNGAGNGIIEVKTAGRNHRFTAEVKSVDRFGTPAILKARLKDYRTRPLLVAPYITRETAERCLDLHLPFIDAAGNAYLEGPGLLIYVVGQPRPVELRQNRFRALNPAGLKIMFALLCRPELIRASYREMAAAAEVALGTVGPVMEDLDTRGFFRSKSGSKRDLRDPERMLQEWVIHYPVTLRPKLNPRRFQAAPERLYRTKITQHNAYWGSEMAAEKLTRFLKPAHFTIYAREPIARLAAATRMRADPTGNVEILDAFWNFENWPENAGLVPPVLAYADLLATNDGRNAEAAKLIYEQRIEPTFRQAE